VQKVVFQQGDLILPELQQHFVQGLTALQQCVDELINTHSVLLFVLFERL